MWDELKARCDALEESYEFALAYAAQGLSGDEAAASTGEMRAFLDRSDAALSGLADVFATLVDGEHLHPRERYQRFIELLARDARDAQAAVQLVLAQPFISSQLVDNLNASIHLRALLTDVFLLDEIVRTHQRGHSSLP